MTATAQGEFAAAGWLYPANWSGAFARRIRRSGRLVRSIEKAVNKLFFTEGNRPQTKQIRASARIVFGILVP